MAGLIIGLGIVLLILAWIAGTYNSLVNLRNRAKEAFSTMDVYLKKRWDLVPNLVETVKGYAKHESETLEKVISLRNVAYSDLSEDQKIETNKQLSQGLSKIMAVAESYPDLKANSTFLSLQTELSKIENDIANSRKYYNGIVRKLNTKIEMFPSNIIAGMFKFETQKMFEVSSEEERENVKVQF